jgi:hypothetical protein
MPFDHSLEALADAPPAYVHQIADLENVLNEEMVADIRLILRAFDQSKFLEHPGRRDIGLLEMPSDRLIYLELPRLDKPELNAGVVPWSSKICVIPSFFPIRPSTMTLFLLCSESLDLDVDRSR